MKDEIKEILSKDNIHIIECEENWCNAYGYEKSQLKEDLLDYITNLQEKLNNQAEEINRLVKQREKFMKKYGYLKEENEKLQKRNKEIYDGFIATQEELSDYAIKIEKAIEHIKQHQLIFENQYEELSGFDNHLLNILNGDDE